MKKIPLNALFAIALFFALFGTALFPRWQLLAFAPFLVFSYYRISLLQALWISCGAGLILDFLSTPHFGLMALNYTLTTLILFPQKRHFFEDKPFTLSVFTALFSLLSTLLHLFLFYTFETHPVSFTLSLWTDLLFMPCIDGVYAFLCFYCPMRGYEKLHRYLLNKKSLSEENV